MRHFSVFSLSAFVALGIFVDCAVAQQVRRDPAVSAVQAAIAAMGGAQQASSIATAILAGHATKYTNSQPSQLQFISKYKVLSAAVAFRRELMSEDLVEATTVDSVRINGTVEQGFDMPQEDS